MHRGNFFHLSLNLTLVCLLVVMPSLHVQAGPNLEAKIIRVTAGGAASPTCGAGWEDGSACSLQFALQTRAAAGDEIWVKAGTYTPSSSGDRSATFQLVTGVSVYGGFAGTETQRDQRDWAANLVILSGDLSRDDGADFLNIGENSYHVVTGAAGAVLDSVTIQGGNANEDNLLSKNGGGMYNFSSSPTLTNVIFHRNTAACGGGMYNGTDSHPVLTYVTFDSNKAEAGGGLCSSDGTNNNSPVLTHVAFYNNIADATGGGMAHLYYGQPTLTYVTFANNTAGDSGGGMYVAYGSPLVTNANFSSNTAAKDGGAISNYSNSITIINATFSENVAASGGGMFNILSEQTLTNVTLSGNRAIDGTGGGIWNSASQTTIHNSILWGNSPDQIDNDDIRSTSAVSYSDVQGGHPGTGNLDADPRLAPFGDYGGEMESIALLPGSPAIDAASENCPITDQRGVARSTPNCDMGAFESQGFTLSILAGNNQSTAIDTSFAQPLAVSVTANATQEPVAGGLVTFTPPASGASAILASNPVTITNGVASVIATANEITGTYTVTASTPGAAPQLVFNLTNRAPSAEANTSAILELSANSVFVSDMLTLTLTVSPSVSTLGAPTGTVTFMDHTAAGSTILGTVPLTATTGSAQATIAISGLAIGQHTLTASYSGDGQFNGSTSSPVVVTVITSDHTIFIPILGR